MDAAPMLAAAVGFAVLLASAAWAKLRDLRAFRAVVADYRLVPPPLLGTASTAAPAVESLLAAAWLGAPWNADLAAAAALGTAVLMAAYGSAIAANLLRGRVWVDCGCGGGEQVSWVLVARNAVLALLALAPLSIGGPAPPSWAAAAMALPIVAAAACLYLAAGALVANAAAMREWREAGS